MTSDKLKLALRKQLGAEVASSYLYLALSYEFRYRSLPGFAHWFHCQSREEMDHAERIADYLTTENVLVVLDAIAAPTTPWSTPAEAFSLVKDHERTITEDVRLILSMAREESDPGVEILMCWFVEEQREEEHTANHIYERLRMVGKDHSGVLFIDRELGKRNPCGK